MFLEWAYLTTLLPALLQFEYPASFTTCVQELENGSWVFPGHDGSWLCAKPALRIKARDHEQREQAAVG
jgi:hypothetical protein